MPSILGSRFVLPVDGVVNRPDREDEPRVRSHPRKNGPEQSRDARQSSYDVDGPLSLQPRCPLRISALLPLVLVPLLFPTGAALAQINSNTGYKLDLSKPKEAAKKAEWSEPDKIKATGEGLGWGDPDDSKSSRDVWIQTKPIALGFSWRPTTVTSIKATVEGAGANGLLYARYSADGKHWTTWQHLEESGKGPGVFGGTLRVPYRDSARYRRLLMEYGSRDDVPWGSDEEALVKDILKREPKFFEKTTPFIGYVQFLYETQLRGGERMKGLRVNAGWTLGGLHSAPKNLDYEKGRDVPWRFEAP